MNAPQRKAGKAYLLEALVREWLKLAATEKPLSSEF
jgi:hypothetical protein